MPPEATGAPTWRLSPLSCGSSRLDGPVALTATTRHSDDEGRPSIGRVLQLGPRPRGSNEETLGEELAGEAAAEPTSSAVASVAQMTVPHRGWVKGSGLTTKF